jgi:chromate reductase
MTDMKILAISGSLRSASHNTALLRAAAELAPTGVEVEVYAELEALPPYNEDRDRELVTPAAGRLRESIATADAVLFATPEYNGTVPGQLKHAVDWASRPRGDSALSGKPVAVIGASPSEHGAQWAQADLRKILAIAGARVLESPAVVVGKAHERIDSDGAVIHAETRDQLEAIVSDLVEHALPVAAAA